MSNAPPALVSTWSRRTRMRPPRSACIEDSPPAPAPAPSPTDFQSPTMKASGAKGPCSGGSASADVAASASANPKRAAPRTSEALGEGFEVGRRVQRHPLSFWRYALDHAGQHLAGADLGETGDAAITRHPFHTLAPAHPAGDLLHQLAADRFWIVGGAGGDVGDQEGARRGDGDGGQRLGHL